MSLIALLDIGTNSVKTLIYDPDLGVFVHSRGVVSKLGEGFFPGGRISEPAIRRNTRVIADELRRCRDLNVQKVYAAGTMILREAENAPDFIDRVFVSTGIEIRVLSAAEEALWSFEASSALHGKGDVLVFDLGGGSLELNRGKNGKFLSGISLPLGASVLSAEFLRNDPPTEAEYLRLREKILQTLSPEEPPPAKTNLVGIGGTVASLAGIAAGLAKYDPAKLEGSTLSRKQIQKQLLYYRSHKQNRIAQLPGIQAGRESTILAGATVVDSLLELTSADSLRVSTQGWRHRLLRLMRK